MKRLNNNEFTPIQKKIIDEIRNKDKNIAIVGGPGTGKTVLLISAMKRPLEDDYGNQVKTNEVLLTYSRPLSETIKNCKVEAKTIYTFCSGLCHKIEDELKRFKESYTTNSVIDKEAKERIINSEFGYDENDSWPKWEKIEKFFLDLPFEKQEELKYETIFVDEGQDLPNECYNFLKKISNRIIVAYDEAQQVGAEEKDNLDSSTVKKTTVNCNRILSVFDLEESFYDLTDNFRNTQSIEAVSKLFYINYNNFSIPLLLSSSKRKGELPEVIFSEPKQSLIDIIAESSYQKNISIAIIVNNRNTFDIIEELMNCSISKGKITTNRFFYKYGKTNIKKDSLENKGVFLMTFKSAKGMEFDEVYIFDCQDIELNSRENRNKVYVATTRAKEKLSFVFDCSKDSKCDILKVINENESLFKIRGNYE